MLFAVWSAYQLVLPASVGSSTDISLPFLSQLELLAIVCPFQTARGKASFVLCGDCFTASQLQENPASTISGPTYLTGGRCNHSLPFCLILASVLPFPSHSVTASWPSVFMFFVFPRNVTSTGFQLWTITSLTSSWNSNGAKPSWSTKPKQPTSQQWFLTTVFPSYFLRTHSLIILELPIPHAPFYSWLFLFPLCLNV